MYAFLVSLSFFALFSPCTSLRVGEFHPPSVDKLVEGSSVSVTFLTSLSSPFCNSDVAARAVDPSVASVRFVSTNVSGTSCSVFLSIDGFNLGYTSVSIEGAGVESPPLAVSVVRTQRLIDIIFTLSVVVLVSISYINMGCTLEWPVIKATMKRPSGPIVGLCCQYLFMPLVGYGLCHALMEDPALRMSLFVIACCPGGGASNFWTILLRGNLNLSVTMTFVSSIVAFASMPAWIYTLGATIFNDDSVIIPYTTIAALIAGLIVPCGIGLGLQRCAPKVAHILSSKLLRPVAFIFITYLLTVGTYANLYIVRLITVKMVIASMILTWSGFACGAIVAKLARFQLEDIVAIAIETGVQNSGIAIVLLRFSLPQPAADMTLVVPALVAAMVPPPLATAWLIMALVRRKKNKQKPAVEVPAIVDVPSSPRRSETRTSLLGDAEGGEGTVKS